MILLLGGTSETAPLAASLAAAGHEVLVSTATDIPLNVGEGRRVRRRSGPLDLDGMLSLIRGEGVNAIVDATHPYAVQATKTALDAACSAGIPCLRLVRPEAVTEVDGIHRAADHGQAARIACAFGPPILLTTGSRHLRPYVEEAQRTGRRLYARVLPGAESFRACREAGLADECIIAERGPFDVESNREVLRRHGIGVLVMKDSGVEGGTLAKVAAAKAEKCEIVLVERPEEPARDVFNNIPSLVEAVGRGVVP
jgi:precorrin-6A/cobalt-precorrin-6A reductase